MVDSLFGKSRFWSYKNIFFEDPPYFDRVTVQWVTDNGMVLRSDFADQDSIGAYFRVISSEPWENNERNDKTIKMNVDFSCWLTDTVNQLQVLVNGNGVIGVAYR